LFENLVKDLAPWENACAGRKKGKGGKQRCPERRESGQALSIRTLDRKRLVGDHGEKKNQGEGKSGRKPKVRKKGPRVHHGIQKFGGKGLHL